MSTVAYDTERAPRSAASDFSTKQNGKRNYVNKKEKSRNDAFGPNLDFDRSKFNEMELKYGSHAGPITKEGGELININYQPIVRNYKTLSIEELIDNCKAGVHPALEELIRRYRSTIFKIALRLARNYDAAEDVTANSCLRICQGIKTCKYPSALTAWINRIIRNVWLDSIRRVQRRSEVSLDILDNINGETSLLDYDVYVETPLQKKVEADERRLILFGAVGALPDVQGRILILYYFEDRSYEEIAEIMAIPIGTVKSRLNRARTALRQNLNDQKPVLLD